MGNTFKYYIILAAIMTLSIINPPHALAQGEADKFKIDSVVYKYYQRCKNNINKVVVLSMCDTLFQMAGKENDKRMQAVALTTKLDYYFYKNIEDSIIAHTNIVKNFAVETNQPTYYYFAWGKRLITYYMKKEQNAFAMYEAEKMLAQATKDDDKIGLTTCYNCLHIIYTNQRQFKLSYKYNLEEVALTEKYNIDNYNISQLYINIINYEIQYTPDNHKSIERWLSKADSTANASRHKFSVKLAYGRYYTLLKDYDKAWEVFEEARQMMETDVQLKSQAYIYYNRLISFYSVQKKYQLALDALNKKIEAKNERGDLALDNSTLRNQADLYMNLGKQSIAAKYYREYITIQDSLDILNAEKNTNEFAALLNLDKLNLENSELSLQAQTEQLKSRKMTIAALVIILLVVCLYLYRENRLNKRLKLSDRKLRHQNRALIESKHELSKSMEKVEAANSMKTVFIQNMSHEIRTPLNSIVGFSQMLSGMVEDNEKAKEFSNIIESNSMDLLRLVDDVLELSKLDSTAGLLETEPTDISIYCQLSIDSVRRALKDGVTIEYLPDSEATDSTIMTNTAGLSKVLTNMMSNAVKFTEHGKITLAYNFSKTDKTVTFVVTDTGIGIAPDQHDNIFKRFVKLDQFTQGTGLGLAICKHLAIKLGGNLSIDKEYTTGSRFVFTIPIE